MNRLPVDAAISRFRRGLALAAVLRFALVFGALICILYPALFGSQGNEVFPLMAIIGMWGVLSYRSMLGARLAADSPSLIASGDFEQAENHIDGVLRRFSLFRTAKLLGLHHLALLRHAQRRWRESALLCQTLLAQRNVHALSRSTLLMMADSMLQLGDLPGAYRALDALYRQRLGLSEVLALHLLQLDYGSRIGAWEPMLAGVGVKIQMAELMASLNSARTQSYLAMAAHEKGNKPLALWLRQRAQLLADADEIAADRPVLQRMFAQNWQT